MEEKGKEMPVSGGKRIIKEIGKEIEKTAKRKKMDMS